MKDFDLQSSANLEKVQQELTKIFESRIAKARLSEKLAELETLPLSKIVAVFEGVTDKIYDSKEGKKLIARYVKAITESKALSDVYSVHEIVHKAPHVDNPQLLLTEAFSMCGKIDKAEYEEAKKKLASIVKECVEFADVTADYVQACEEQDAALNEALDYLVFNKKTYSNLPTYVTNFGVVAECFSKRMKEPSAAEGDENLVEKLNEEISGLNEWETNAIRDISVALLSESDLSQLFEDYKAKCLTKFEEVLSESDSIEAKSHIESMMSQLKNKEYKKETIYEDIFTLAELANTITE